MILHGGDYCPEQWLYDMEIIRNDIKLFKEANINCITLGMFSWSTLEPRDGEYQTQWFKDVLDIILENDLQFILGTATAARPHWLVKKYPTTARIDANGVRQKSGNRHNHCMSSEAFRTKASEIINVQLDIALQYPNLHSIHINNELNGYCYCDECISNFQQYLKDKFGTIENLNHAWWNTFWSHTYSDFDEIEPPYNHGEQSNTSLLVNWERFMTDIHNQYIDFEYEIIKSRTDLPQTTNFCGTPFCTVIDYFEMAKHVDYVSYDVYPQWNIDDNYDVAITAKKDLISQKCLDLDKDFLIMESSPSGADWQSHTMLKSGKLHEASTFLQVLTGAKSCLYFQLKQSMASCEKFHGSVLDINSNPNARIYNYVKDFGAKLGEVGYLAAAEMKKEVAIYLSWDDFSVIRHASGPRKDDYKLEAFYNNIVEYFNNVNINTAFIYEPSKLDQYQTIVIPFGYAMSSSMIEAIKKLKGKTVISFPMLAYVNENDKLHFGELPHNLTDEFGIVNQEFTALTDTYKLTDNTYQYTVIGEVVKAKGAEVLSSFDDDILDCAITKHNYNNSDFYYIAGYPNKESLRTILGDIIGQTFNPDDRCIRNKFIYQGKELWTLINFGKELKIENVLWQSGDESGVLKQYEFAIIEPVNE
ncbi:beta-galactosidase [Mollicutes bacterium LVI A0039]|nr:beta-galactosidase [Mollicutes bacterium LVI A0039]